MLLNLCLIVLILFSIYYIINRIYNNIIYNLPNGLKKVPRVGWSLPILGNLLEFNRDKLGFIKRACAKYGKIFSIEIFRRKMIIICDRSYHDEFFKSKEENMSLYNVLKMLYFGNAFSDKPDYFNNIIKIVKKTVSIRYDEFAPKIMSEANDMIDRLKLKCKDGPMDIGEEMIRFVAYTSARCFIGIKLQESFYDNLIKFTILLNKIVVLTYFLPLWLLKLIFNKELSSYRHAMTSSLHNEIEKYRLCKDKKDSLLFRTAVDFRDEDGSSLNNEEIGDIVVCLLYVSSENTALGLSATIIDLCKNPNYWNRVRDESIKHLENNDYKSLFSSQLFEDCIMESARMNCHIFGLNRTPENKKTLGDYYIGDADVVAYCAPMLMSTGYADEVFKDANTYNPDRYSVNKEPKTPESILIWGNKIHLCPGKPFAIMETKAIMALLTVNFNIPNLPEKMEELDYFSPSAFAERKVKVALEPSNIKIVKNINNLININDKGYLFRDYLSKDQQIDMYKYLLELSKDSEEQKILLEDKDNIDKIKPLTYYNLVYTGTSNCEIPTKIIDWAEKFWNKEIGYLYPRQYFNSVYSQLFGEKSKMDVHKDEHVNYGISISLGASCKFNFDGKEIILNSGDIFVSDFSKIDHGVSEIFRETVPGWFSNEINEDKEIQTFNKLRCSIQIREVKEIDNEKMKISEFRQMVDNN